MNTTAVIFCLALLFVFAVALTSVIVLVARNARDAEREEMENDIDELSAEVEECRRVRVVEHRLIHAMEVALVDAGITPPRRDG